MINDERIPLRLRRALNVESGLNDGIVTPIVVFTLAVVATDLGLEGHGHDGVAGAVLELASGVVVGLAVGLGSALVIGFGSRRRWIAAGGRRLATLAAALTSFALAIALDGNGFIAAFVAGIAFGAALPKDVRRGGARRASGADRRVAGAGRVVPLRRRSAPGGLRALLACRSWRTRS